MLEVKGLKKTFKMSKKQQKIEKTKEKIKVAVADVSFDARPGEILGILGANGAGKTTTLRILASVIKADEGQVCLDGADITGNLMDYRRHIGFLTSELKLEDYFTPNYLFDYFSKRGRLYAIYFLENSLFPQDNEKELFEKFGIDKFAEVKVADMSTGMKQKISLVISIVHNPDIIIFDEPTNGLDPVGIHEIRTLIRSLPQKYDCTVLVSSHLLPEVELMADDIGILNHGHLLFEGTKEELKTNARAAGFPTDNLEDTFLAMIDEDNRRRGGTV